MSGGTKIRAVLHAHSEWSYDAKWTLPAMARLFGGLGFHAVLMTEHDQGFKPDSYQRYRDACAEASTAKCRLIPGIEYSSPDNNIHILTSGLPRFLGEGRPVEHTIKDVQNEGGLAVFAHPVRRGAWKLFEDGWIPYLDGIEAWNRKSDGIAISPTGLELLERTGLPPTAGSDFHTLKQLFPLYHRLDLAAGWSDGDVIGQIKRGLGVPMAAGRPIFDGTYSPRAQPFWTRAERLRRLLRGRAPLR
jgi:predicted metal-dependent phosphoesterase TrpH